MTHYSPSHATQTTVASSFISEAIRPSIPMYSNIEWSHEVLDRTFWCFMNPQGRPSFTADLLTELQDIQQRIATLADVKERDRAMSVGWVVLASRVPGIFSLGGDLTLFAAKIRSGDRESLRRYAYGCIDISYRNSTGYDGGAISIGLAQGEALGGGFESLLSCDLLVAERRARFGLPEVLMNMFPGMGAHCFLTRRIGSSAATKMILSGQVYTAQAMHEMGIVDILAEDGEGESAVRSYITKNGSRHHAHSAIYQARRRVSPVSLQELRDVTDIWVETAMALTPQDLRRMAHLVAAQDRTLRQPTRQDVAAE